MELRVLSLYPEQMNIYADRGNIVFLRRRCEWRGIGFQHYGAGPGEHVDPAGHDLFYVGGGQDRDQRMVAADMVASKRQDLAAAVESGAALLAVCGGFQLLGHSYRVGEEKLPGLGLVDIETVREPGPRAGKASAWARGRGIGRSAKAKSLLRSGFGLRPDCDVGTAPADKSPAATDGAMGLGLDSAGAAPASSDGDSS